MGDYKNMTVYHDPHISTTPKDQGNEDYGKVVVTSMSYDSNGKVVGGKTTHHTAEKGDTSIFNFLVQTKGVRK